MRSRFQTLAVPVLGVLLAQLGSPALARPWSTPKFKVEQSDDRFSNDGLTTITGHWNKVSKRSIAGGTHIDSTGVYLDPYVIKKRATGEVGTVGLFFQNLDTVSQRLGDSLAIGIPEEVAFLTGEGGPIVLPLRMGKSRRGEPYNCGALLGCSAELVESGQADLSEEQYQRIMNAQALAIKIQGSRRSYIYEVDQVLPSFQENLRVFIDNM